MLRRLSRNWNYRVRKVKTANKRGEGFERNAVEAWSDLGYTWTHTCWLDELKTNDRRWLERELFVKAAQDALEFIKSSGVESGDIVDQLEQALLLGGAK